jgi:hypothetical protein
MWIITTTKQANACALVPVERVMPFEALFRALAPLRCSVVALAKTASFGDGPRLASRRDRQVDKAFQKA